MERPTYEEDIFNRQNDIYAVDVVERYINRPKTADMLITAITEAFTLGAGGYEGSFDAACVLEEGGLAVLLGSLGLSEIDQNLSEEIDASTFETSVRASVDFGASWDDLEEEILDDAIGDTDILGGDPLDGPLIRRFNLPLDGSERPEWRVD